MEILIPLLLPLITAALIQILGRFTTPNVRDGAHTLMAAVTFYFVLQLIDPVMNGEQPTFFVAEMFPGLNLLKLNHWDLCLHWLRRDFGFPLPCMRSVTCVVIMKTTKHDSSLALHWRLDLHLVWHSVKIC